MLLKFSNIKINSVTKSWAANIDITVFIINLLPSYRVTEFFVFIHFI